MNTYAGKVIREIEEMQRQDERAGRNILSRKDRVNALSAQEIVNKLRNEGARTIERLARDLNLETHVVWAYINAMASEKVVKVEKSRRGKAKVSLNPELR